MGMAALRPVVIVAERGHPAFAARGANTISAALGSAMSTERGRSPEGVEARGQRCG